MKNWAKLKTLNQNQKQQTEKHHKQGKLNAPFAKEFGKFPIKYADALVNHEVYCVPTALYQEEFFAKNRSRIFFFCNIENQRMIFAVESANENYVVLSCGF